MNFAVGRLDSRLRAYSRKSTLKPALTSIQISRGIAALAIVLFHLSAAVAAPKYFNQPVFTYYFGAGSAGVNFFFVLSGFLITYVHFSDIGKPRQLYSYIVKRCSRIYPPYLITLLAVTVVASFMPGMSDSFPRNASTILKTILLLPQDPAVVGGTGAPIIIVAWSLQYEMLFYALFAILIIGGWVGISLVGIAMVGCWLFEPYLAIGFLNGYFITLFGLGVIVALLVRGRCFESAAVPAVILGAGGMMLMVLLVNARELFPGQELDLHKDSGGILAFGLFSSVLIFGLVSRELAGWRPVSRAGELLGNASYVLYLTHFPIISVMCKLARKIGLSGFAGATITWIVTLAVCIVAAILFHIVFEKPLQTIFRYKKQKDPLS
ncbi:acyltransferase [Mesorhizobium sp. M1295]|uniref:acyltransferase family protein n=1 Tax=Mesorhizobium sp. M1295 TaxID=2957076 RepID=UPI00333A1E49